jgi:HD-GYP domain-containing protein (c-di-GMP phosphodiesterase class II)
VHQIHHSIRSYGKILPPYINIAQSSKNILLIAFACEQENKKYLSLKYNYLPLKNCKIILIFSISNVLFDRIQCKYQNNANSLWGRIEIALFQNFNKTHFYGKLVMTEFTEKKYDEMQNIIRKFEQLTDITIELTSERNTAKLLEKILFGAISLTNADGGTIYRVLKDAIKIEIIYSNSLNMHFSDSTKNAADLPKIPLFDENGQTNLKNVVSYSYHHDKTLNIADAYDTKDFDFQGTKSFDAKNNYRSTSFLTVPLKNHENETVAMLQLINAIDPITQNVIAFDSVDQRFCESLASQAATVLTRQQLIISLEKMFESMISLIAHALDAKSPYNGGHCQRVPELTMMIAEAAHQTSEGYLKNFTLSDADRYELKIAGLLHDCGKVTTPEYVVDKAKKLETIFDRIALVETRFEVLKRDAEIALLKQQNSALKQGNTLSDVDLDDKLQPIIASLEDDLDFLKACNTGGEFMSQDKIDRLNEIQQKEWKLGGQNTPLLNKDELTNLSIARGTLNDDERKVINNHISATISMLSAIKWPKHLQNVTAYAGGHHERVDGKGYPNGLKREEMPIQARAMAIADVFEALTASDRPYKSGKKLSEALFILEKMSQEGHIDPDLYHAFITHNVHKKYAEAFLPAEQIDI